VCVCVCVCVCVPSHTVMQVPGLSSLKIADYGVRVYSAAV
jgi:hypothetical protein